MARNFTPSQWHVWYIVIALAATMSCLYWWICDRNCQNYGRILVTWSFLYGICFWTLASSYNCDLVDSPVWLILNGAYCPNSSPCTNDRRCREEKTKSSGQQLYKTELYDFRCCCCCCYILIEVTSLTVRSHSNFMTAHFFLYLFFSLFAVHVYTVSVHNSSHVSIVTFT